MGQKKICGLPDSGLQAFAESIHPAVGKRMLLHDTLLLLVLVCNFILDCGSAP